MSDFYYADSADLWHLTSFTATEIARELCMAVEQKPVGKEAQLPNKISTAPCGAQISSLRDARAHALTCKDQKCAGGGKR